MKGIEYTERVKEVINDFRGITNSSYETLMLLVDFMYDNYERGEDDIAHIYYDAIKIICKENIEANKGE